MQVQEASNVSWSVTHSVSFPDLIRTAAPSPLYRTSLHSLFCVSVRSVGPFEPDLIAGLEIKEILTQMAKKSVLLEEVYARALRVSQKREENPPGGGEALDKCG